MDTEPEAHSLVQASKAMGVGHRHVSWFYKALLPHSSYSLSFLKEKWELDAGRVFHD